MEWWVPFVWVCFTIHGCIQARLTIGFTHRLSDDWWKIPVKVCFIDWFEFVTYVGFVRRGASENVKAELSSILSHLT